jgi:hypothetical protein
MTAAPTGMVLRQDLRRRERAVARLRLWHLDHRLDRTWRQGRREGDARLLASMRGRIGATVLAATVAGVAAEITFVDGYHLSLGSCHGPTVAALAGLIADRGAVTLQRAARHPTFWELDFISAPQDAPPGPHHCRSGRVALLAGSVTESRGGASSGRPALRPTGAGVR